MWEKTKEFFYHSWTVFQEMGMILLGAVTTIAGTLDWAPFESMLGTGTGMSKNTVLTLGGLTLVKGILGYVGRVHNTKEVDGHLIPKGVVVKTAKDKAK